MFCVCGTDALPVLQQPEETVCRLSNRLDCTLDCLHSGVYISAAPLLAACTQLVLLWCLAASVQLGRRYAGQVVAARVFLLCLSVGVGLLAWTRLSQQWWVCGCCQFRSTVSCVWQTQRISCVAC